MTIGTARLAALELIADRTALAGDAAERHRETFRVEKTARSAEAKGYAEGRVAAFNEAHKIVQVEMERLRHLWQSGSLTIDSFGLSV